jgi:hypothetical protein
MKADSAGEARRAVAVEHMAHLRAALDTLKAMAPGSPYGARRNARASGQDFAAPHLGAQGEGR